MTMRYHIPSNEEIVVAIYRSLSKFISINSQRKLHEVVVDELKEIDSLYKASPQRIRKLAAKAGFISEIHLRDGKEKMSARCPVCDSKLKKVKNLTLWGKKATTGFACTTCPYRSGKKMQIPTRYNFHLKK